MFLQEAVGSIGLAVLNGGVTTFLALVLLGASSSHVFLSFFKVPSSWFTINLEVRQEQ